MRLTPLLLAALLLTANSCNGPGSGKPAARNRIPDNDLVAILTDTYLTSGMLDLYSFNITWGRRDSTLNYIDVIESHGYTWEQFNATMKYYFASKPKKLSRIYDRVTGSLLELEATMMADTRAEVPAEENLWNGKFSYNLPEDFTRDPIWFDIPLEQAGEYVLRADIRLFEDDHSLNPRVTVYFSHTGSDGEEQRDYWEEAALEQDGQLHSVMLHHYTGLTRGVRLRGWLLNHDNRSGRWQKHARVTNISITLSDEGIVK